MASWSQPSSCQAISDEDNPGRREDRTPTGESPRVAAAAQEWRRDRRMHADIGDDAAKGAPMRSVDVMFEERDLDRDAAKHWWIFLLTGIAWLVFALLLF